MKRTLLFIASLLFLASTFAQAQSSLVLKDKEGNVITGQTIELFCPASVGLTSFKLDVLNSATVAKSVKVKKMQLSMLPGTEDYLTICWESCYPPFIFESPTAIAIEPSALCTNFEGDLSYPTTVKGTSTVKFVFFDEANTNDSSYVIVNYNIGTIGIAENLIKLSKVSNAYPNPASSVVNFDYQLPANANNAKININNLLGTTVSSIELVKNEGKASLSLSNLKDGVYFYTLIINNTATVTRKFVVKR
ncbi:MAG TPA: T9SS type A sorting domain-containing protein [Lentimicrobium sp.]|nr:T9SS type A sorting domain-containing protein [Lentimicrobium sp.]